jgi:hypothetical protein
MKTAYKRLNRDHRIEIEKMFLTPITSEYKIIYDESCTSVYIYIIIYIQ